MSISAADPAAQTLSPRTAALLNAPVVPLLVRLAWPNVLLMLAQAATGLVETYFVAQLGTDALAGMALVFPPIMLTQMISAGSIGGAISSAVARALGARRADVANALVLHALLINASIGLALSLLFLAFGPSIYRLLGGSGEALDAALRYSNVVFAGNALLWVMNALASVIRGTGNMLVPGIVTCVGALFLVPLSPCLIFGFGPFPALGIAGGGVALLAYYLGGMLVLAWYLLSGRSLVRLTLVSIRMAYIKDIVVIGGIAAISSIQTNLTIAITTALVATHAGAAAVAGYGTGARLEYLLIPIVFGLGAPLVALVGTNIGANNPQRALRIALAGGAIAFLLTETIGVAAALWPRAWLGLFGNDEAMLVAGSTYLRIVGPFYGFFGLGLAFYFASQGAGRLFWPLVAGSTRVAIAAVGGIIVLRLGASLPWLYAALAGGLLAYGTMIATAVASGGWSRGR
jgi:putative MATE family efflux protein